MKKITLLLSLMITIFAFSQCKINGEEVLTKGVPATFTLDQDIAQCADCHQWSFKPNIFKFESEQKNSSVKIIPQEVGAGEIHVSVLTSGGLKNCAKSVVVKDRLSSQSTKAQDNCNIKANTFDEIKLDSKALLLYPDDRSLNQEYSWEINYFDGSKKIIDDVAPIIYSANGFNIKSIILNIKTTKCKKGITKEFTEGFFR